MRKKRKSGSRFHRFLFCCCCLQFQDKLRIKWLYPSTQKNGTHFNSSSRRREEIESFGWDTFYNRGGGEHKSVLLMRKIVVGNGILVATAIYPVAVVSFLWKREEKRKHILWKSVIKSTRHRKKTERSRSHFSARKRNPTFCVL